MKVDIAELYDLMHRDVDEATSGTHEKVNRMLARLYPDIVYNGAQTRMVFNALIWSPVAHLYPELVDAKNEVAAAVAMQKRTDNGNAVDVPTEPLKGHEWMNRLPNLGP